MCCSAVAWIIGENDILCNFKDVSLVKTHLTCALRNESRHYSSMAWRDFPQRNHHDFEATLSMFAKMFTLPYAG